jgi:hypothetical protein
MFYSEEYSIGSKLLMLGVMNWEHVYAVNNNNNNDDRALSGLMGVSNKRGGKL